MAELTETISALHKKENKKNDKLLLVIILAHFPLSMLLSIGYGTWLITFILSFLVTILGIFLYNIWNGEKSLQVANGVIIMLFSAIFIQAQLGRIEMHFHVFSGMAFLIIYRNLYAVLGAAVTIALHHVLFNLLQQFSLSIGSVPIVIFNYGHGWGIVFYHAMFVVFEAGVLMYFALLQRNIMEEGWILTFNSQTLISQNQILKPKLVSASQSTQSLVDIVIQKSESIHKSSTIQVDSIENISLTIEDFANSVRSISQNAALQFEHANKISNTRDVIVQNTALGTDKLTKSNTRLITARDKANVGSKHLTKLTESMEEIQSSYNDMLNVISGIYEIADRINLLSLNASIESARAGEFGRGFSVVAQEISKLADQTASNLKTSDKLIKNVRTQISLSKENVIDTSELFNSITEEVTGLEVVFQEFQDALKKQSDTFESLSDDLDSLKSESEDTKSSTNLLNNAIAEMKGGVRSFIDSTKVFSKEASELKSISQNSESIVATLVKGVEELSFESAKYESK